MNKTIIAVTGVLEIFILVVIFGMLFIIVNEIKSDPLDVNRDGQANIVDLSVLAAKLNEQGQ